MGRSPFKSRANRLTRPIEELLSRAVGSRRVLRLVGPRQTGKTELIRELARRRKAPLIEVRIPRPRQESGSAEQVLRVLAKAIEKACERAPLLRVAYDRLCTRMPALAASGPGIVALGSVLWLLEQAAKDAKLCPIVLFDHAEELVIPSTGSPQMCAAWSIRNEIQHHFACCYVLAGSDLGRFRNLFAGMRSPFLNNGVTVQVPLLTASELNAWAIPIFERGRRRVTSLEPVNTRLAGKIGEVVKVLDRLWVTSKPGDVLTEREQNAAVLAAAETMAGNAFRAGQLGDREIRTLRKILNQSPRTTPADLPASALLWNPKQISSVHAKLAGLGLIEVFDDVIVPTSPLTLIRAFPSQRERK